MKNISLVFFFIFSCFSLTSQTLNGLVTNEYKTPLQMVNILNTKNGNHIHTNEKGEFVFENTSVGDSLQFSHVGYQTKTLVVKKTTTILKVTLIDKPISLNEVVISPQKNTLQLISDIDIKTNPVNSSQDILRKVPGLFIGQHAGGGKAEQIFLRGFDIDHGTDITINVDGLPVNMVSHAHGQGYADLHFVIPETIDNVDFGKGLYYQDKGNFNTAGYVDFKTKENLKNSTVKVEAGQFDTFRLLGMFNLLQKNKHNAYIASEFLITDGPFESPQNFNRINVFGKYTGNISDTDKINITASHFDSKWDASGQIPQRAVDSSLISRFGAIDDTEGGNTSRTNFLINYDKKIDTNSSLKNSVYLNTYDFELYSNFTYFLDDPVNGDQIKQKENRTIFGVQSDYLQTFSNDILDGNWQAGISLRNDQSKDNELSHTLNRTETLEQIQFGDINETNVGGYIGTNINIKKWSFNPSIRFDYFDFQYNDHLTTAYTTQSATKAIASPKLNISYNQSKNFQSYLNFILTTPELS